MHKTASPTLLPDVAFDAVALARPLDWVGMDGMALPIRLAGEGGAPLLVPRQRRRGGQPARPRRARHPHVAAVPAAAGGVGQRSAGRPLAAAIAGCLHRLAEGPGRTRAPAPALRPPAAAPRPAERQRRLEAVPGGDRGGACRRPPAADAAAFRSNTPVPARPRPHCRGRPTPQRFAEDFAAAPPLSVAAVHDWLAGERGLAATPHAQRSRAEVRVELRPAFDELPLASLVDALEAALGTPVQTAVKREDEQAFAQANAANLMFCEDAARRVSSVLAADPRIAAWSARRSPLREPAPARRRCQRQRQERLRQRCFFPRVAGEGQAAASAVERQPPSLWAADQLVAVPRQLAVDPGRGDARAEGHALERRPAALATARPRDGRSAACPRPAPGRRHSLRAGSRARSTSNSCAGAWANFCTTCAVVSRPSCTCSSASVQRVLHQRQAAGGVDVGFVLLFQRVRRVVGGEHVEHVLGQRAQDQRLAVGRRP